jgi:nitrite reductase/ring-hydroxylating ferredoxin subunit
MSDDIPKYWSQLPHAPAAGVLVCALNDLADGGVAMFEFGPRFGSGEAPDKPFRLLVLRSGESVLGYVNRCAHFGVPLAANVEQLIYKPHISISCNVHYARYRWQDGVCEFGDCEGESLLAVPLGVRDGNVEIAVSPAPTFDLISQ